MSKKNSKTESLGTRMKEYEKESELVINPKDHIIIRIDGHKFSKYTKGMKKPFDNIFAEAMKQTTIDLLQEFNAVISYTQSDEITLLLPSLMNTEKHKGQNKPKWCHISGGRTQKLASLVAGFTTMSFNKHFGDILFKEISWNEYKTDATRKYLDIMKEKVGKAWFDCRVFGVPSDEEAFNAVMWRVRDAEKNSRSMFAQTFCSHKELQNKTGLEQVQYCKEKTGEDWELIEDRYKYGILVKKERYLKPVSGGSMDYAQNEFVQRSRIVTYSEKLVFSDNAVDKVMRKYL